LSAKLQAVDHPYLVVYSKTSALKGGNTVDLDSAKNACGICHEPAEDPVVSYLFCSCAHLFFRYLSFLKVQRNAFQFCALVVYLNSNFCWCDLN
jgi:hypothetical protein